MRRRSLAHAHRVEESMQLPDALIESLLWTLGTSEAGNGPRRSPRMSTRCIAMLTPMAEGTPRESDAREVLVRDISANGASLVLASPLRCAQFVLKIPTVHSGPLSIVCERRHGEKCAEGGFAVGARFIRFLPRGGATPIPRANV